MVDEAIKEVKLIDFMIYYKS